MAAGVTAACACARLQIVATACVLLAGKVEETARKVKDTLKAGHGILRPGQMLEENSAVRTRAVARRRDVMRAAQQDFWNLKDRVLLAERMLLRTLGFDFSIDLPYTYVVGQVKQIRGAHRRQRRSPRNLRPGH